VYVGEGSPLRSPCEGDPEMTTREFKAFLVRREDLAREIEEMPAAKVGSAYHVDRQRALESCDRMVGLIPAAQANAN
jgi:hypothetical protein